MTHGGGGRPGKGGRQVTEDEAALWRQLTHSVDKVKAKPRVATHGGEAVAPTPVGPPEPKQARRRNATPAPPGPAAPAPPRVRQPPPPAEFDRRTLRQVAAGRVPIDGVLDLHGLHQDAAHSRLRAFLVSSQAKGHRIVLIVTGKGGDSADPGTRGVLRRSVPRWLDEPEFRAVVLGYAAAGARHGGGGALYVRLRKARDA
jgi:DNA-nicking Smr family endonuclease